MLFDADHPPLAGFIFFHIPKRRDVFAFRNRSALFIQGFAGIIHSEITVCITKVRRPQIQAMDSRRCVPVRRSRIAGKGAIQFLVFFPGMAAVCKGRTGQREANAKADEWLDKGVKTRRKKVADVWPEYLAQRQLTTSESNWKPMESRWRIWIAPNPGRKKLEALTDQDLQHVLDLACAAGLSKKTLQNLFADLAGLLKFARKSGYTACHPDGLLSCRPCDTGSSCARRHF